MADFLDTISATVSNTQGLQQIIRQILIEHIERKFEMYQQLILIGHLGADPAMRYTPSGVSVTTFRLAVNRHWTNSDGQSQEKTTWFNITAWNRLAETTNQYLKKGQQVCVVGEVEDARPWTDREGNMRASIEVRAREVKFLSRSGDGAVNASSTASETVEEAQLEGAEVPF